MTPLARLAAALVLLVLPAWAQHAVKVTSDHAKVRTKPSAGASVLGTVEKGQVYARIAFDGEWRKIWFGHASGWIHRDHVEEADRPVRRVTAGSLNVRRGPGTGYGIAGTAPENSWWALVGSQGDWKKIWFRGATRWVHGAHLSASPAPSTPDLPKSSIGFVNLPASGPGFYASQPADRRWGTPNMVYGMMRAAQTWDRDHSTFPRIGIGDLSRATGGYFPPHVTHRDGRDADIRPVAETKYEGPLDIYSSIYSRWRTKHWFTHHLIPQSNVYRILFNDPAIDADMGLVQSYPGHHNHHHADFR